MYKTQPNENHPAAKHGYFGTRIYNTWAHMKQRCYNPKNASYDRYGARGIKVCEEWQNFISFCEWAMSNGYNDKLTLDRINSDKDYCPENCRWADIEMQNNNKSDTNLITYNGKTQSIAKWAKELGIKYSTLNRRILTLKMPIEKAFTNTNHSLRYITYKGETHYVTEWAKILDINVQVLKSRLRAGWDVERVFTTPLKHLKAH